MANEKLIIKYGDYTDDFNIYPEASLVATLRRGVSHLRGSEVASKVLGKMEKFITTGEDAESTAAKEKAFKALTPAERKATFKAFREQNPAAVAAWDAEAQVEVSKALAEGTLGTSVRGPAVDPLMTIVNRLIRTAVINRLKANKVKPPKKAEDKIEFPNGDKFTIEDLVERWKARPADYDPILRDAKKVLAEQERAAKKAGEAGLESL